MDNNLRNNNRDIELKTTASEAEDYATTDSIREALKELPEILSFIQRLQDCILRQRTLIHKLYGKLKEGNCLRKSTRDAFTQTSESDVVDCQSEGKIVNLVEDIKKAAENAVHQTGFVYEETSGLYYDYNTGYYYNAELGLYYDGQSGTYYCFDESSKSFQFHSQVALPSNSCTDINSETITEDNPNKRNIKIVEDVQQMPKRIKQEPKEEVKEEGECSETDSESEMIEDQNEKGLISTCASNTNNVHIEDCKIKLIVPQNIQPDDEVANAWPPCLRVVVKETGLENLLIGSLFIVTCTGGTLGREGDHAIVIPDINISKHHAKVSFSEEERCYNIVDLGSRNGTFVDGKRISVALRESEPVCLQHKTVVRVGTTHLECHLHQGRDTCNDCEPGCALRKQTGNVELTDKDHETKEARHRSELRRLRKRFGLDKLSTKEAGPSLAAGYQDRAEERRKTVGSQDHNAKTETASLHESIQSSNKGFKMLSKMGWAEGQSLGKDSSKGIVEPVLVEQRPEKAGLGSDTINLIPPDPKAKKKAEVWKKAQKRFQELDD